jgi:hypothetical protein
MNEMFKINDVSGQCGEVVDHAGQFLPYAQKKLGFNKPVGVNFVSDPQNAKDPLGKTGYYDPNNMEITIFVDKRHVKDILRSLSHELVHHTQNCRGEFDNGVDTGPGYAQKDPHMRKMEAEAYLLGNGFLFRDWEDHLKLKESKIMAKASKKPDGDGDGVPPWADKDDDNPDVQEEGIFAPSHYCAHHGGVQMEGEIKLGKVIGHNWNKKLQKVTKYDMQFKDGTILEGVKAEDLYVTEASLAEMHHGHEAKEDHELTEAPNEVSFTYKELPRSSRKLADKLGIKGPFLAPVGDGSRKSQLRALFSAMSSKVRRMEKRRAKQRTKDLQDRVKEKTFLGSPDLPDPLDAGPEFPEIPEPGPESKPEDARKKVGVPKASKYKDAGFKDIKYKELQEDEEIRRAIYADEEDLNKDIDGDGHIGRPPKKEKNENWSRGNKDKLLFERLVKKWAK